MTICVKRSTWSWARSVSDEHDWLRSHSLTAALGRFGLPAAPACRGEVLELLAEHVAIEHAEFDHGGAGDHELIRLLCLQLFTLGHAADALAVWRAKEASFDLHCGIDVQFLCGAGVAETKAHLSASADRDAAAALAYLDHCEECGNFADFSATQILADGREYYGLT